MIRRGVAQPGSAVAWGAKGRRFKSCRPDHLKGSFLGSSNQNLTFPSFPPYHKSLKSQKKAPLIQKTDKTNLGFSWRFHMFNAFTGSVHGRVQGVGFRYFSKDCAEQLNLTGWVRNLPDGSVEIFANGPLSALEQFMQRLKVGPIGSRVEQTKFQWLETTERLEGFEIRA